MSDELRTPEGGAPSAQQQQPQWQTDTSALSTIYTNFCQAKGTPEELVLDFGLNPYMMPNPAEPVKLTHRVVMNFYTAKRLLSLLMAVIQQHESSFGALELDFNKRMRGGRPASPSLVPKQ
jgi:hypothetical protein